jgi:TldD protein
MVINITSVNEAYEHFGVTEGLLTRTLSAAIDKGGDYADLFFEHTLTNSLSLEDGEVNRAYPNIDYGVGVRVVSGERTGYVYIENITPDGLMEAAKTAAYIASKGNATPPVRLKEMEIKHNLYPVVHSWEEMGIAAKMPYLQSLNDRIFACDGRVIKVSGTINDSTSHILFCNSLGQTYYDCRPMSVASTKCVMRDKTGRTESYTVSKSGRYDAGFLNQALFDALVKEVTEKTSLMFNAKTPKGGEMPVVMGAGSAGILLHEAIGHSFEADFNRKDISIFSGKIGQKICNKTINIVDDGTLPYNRGSVNYDDEGIVGQRTYIVREGVLTSYLHDRISARFYGIAPTGNGRRESFRYPPLPRMRATYMEAGEYSEDEIIASVKKGVFVSDFTNGEVQIGEGDFTFFVKSGRMIENGKLTEHIKDVNIIGNGPVALSDITMVSSNFKIDNGSWTCGKDGQSCPVSLGMPSALVKKLTVGGEN